MCMYYPVQRERHTDFTAKRCVTHGVVDIVDTYVIANIEYR